MSSDNLCLTIDYLNENKNNIKMSNNNCCVVNCANTYKNTTGIKFYSFPNRKHELHLKERWIKAVNRVQ